jgi:hypothetical protein
MIERRPPGPLPEGELRQSAARSGQLGKPPPRGPEQTPQGGDNKSPERQPLISQEESQANPDDPNVGSANTENAESSEPDQKDKHPLKRRRSLAFAGPLVTDELLSISENKKP